MELWPFLIVKGDCFHQFMKVAVFEYVLTHSATLKKLCESITLTERVNLKKNSQNIYSICLTVDYWTSRINNSYMPFSE